ncbi:MAG: ribosome maturation factor RimP [Actinobacteria bacterium]|nr:ribosome maturation factor RimP [Actinomycetota bacterium]
MDATEEGDIYSKVKKVIQDLMDGLAMELVDAEIVREGGQLFLRIYVDRNGGVTMDDCAGASGLIGKVLEREGIMMTPHVLEVMSPGVYRRLKRPEEFVKNLGKRLKVRLASPFEGKKDYSGVLVSAGEDSFTLELGEELLEFRYESLSSAKLDPELPW